MICFISASSIVLLGVTVKELLKLAHICQSCHKNRSGMFFVDYGMYCMMAVLHCSGKCCVDKCHIDVQTSVFHQYWQYLRNGTLGHISVLPSVHCKSK